IRRLPSSRATIAAGTSPPRVMQTIASNGPAPASRQASARASRWNWSKETGNALCEPALVLGDALTPASGKGALAFQLLENAVHGLDGCGHGVRILAAHYDRVLEPGGREGGVGADADARMEFCDLTQAGRIDAFRKAA